MCWLLSTMLTAANKCNNVMSLIDFGSSTLTSTAFNKQQRMQSATPGQAAPSGRPLAHTKSFLTGSALNAGLGEKSPGGHTPHNGTQTKPTPCQQLDAQDRPQLDKAHRCHSPSEEDQQHLKSRWHALHGAPHVRV